MHKIKGIHFYVNIKNILEIINNEEKKDEDLKRTIHRLQTYFCGFSELISIYGGHVEKYTVGRVHVVFEIDENNIEEEIANVFKTIVACFIYNNEIFNSISKYTQYNYINFNIHAGMDYGNYFWYEIEGADNEKTTIGAVANNAAKIQTYADKNYIFIMDKLYNKLPNDIKEKFIEIDDKKKEDLNGKIKNSKIYEAKYDEIFDQETMNSIRERLKPVRDRVDEEANKLNITEISFTDAINKLNFKKLSINNNKKLDGGVLCADIRGFTKLFNKSDSNLEDLCDIIKKIYSIMGETIEQEDGIKVQYQGDRIVALFHDFDDKDPYIIRMLRSALKLNEKIQEFNKRYDVSEKLKNNNITIGIGCACGNIIATRLGAKGKKDNIILSYASKIADKCEDKYAEKNCIVIDKATYNEIIKKINNSTSLELEYEVLREIFTAINTTGFYTTSLTFIEFQNKIKEKEDEKLAKKAQKLFQAKVIINSQGESVNIKTRPWGVNCEQVKPLRDTLFCEKYILHFKDGYEYSEYANKVFKDFLKVKTFFPLLNICMLPTIKMKEIFIYGQLVPKDLYNLLKTDSHYEKYSLYIFASYPFNFPYDDITVVDAYETIRWDLVPKEHRHIKCFNGKLTGLCTHHPLGEINDVKQEYRSIKILMSAWKLFYQVNLYLETGKWELEELPHGNEALKYIKKCFGEEIKRKVSI